MERPSVLIYKHFRSFKNFKIIFLFIVYYLGLYNLSAQPIWNSGPDVDPYPLRLELSFNLDRPSYVYYCVFPLNHNPSPYPSEGTIKNWSTATLPYGSIIDNGTVTYTGGLVGTDYIETIFGETEAITYNHPYTIWVVAEEISTGTLTSVSRIFVTTPPCPAIDMDFGYVQPEECVNLGAELTLRFTIFDADPDVSGVYPGTEFYIDWGDSQDTTWYSTDGDPQPFIPKTFSHTYFTTLDCNYEVYAVVTSACSPTVVKQFSTAAIIHGRDIPDDGDGFLEIVNDDDGSTLIEICEGTETTIVLRDNSTWNCQSPTFMNGDPAPANTDPRALEWLYGEDPTGTVTNTITGNVVISNLGNANSSGGQTSDRYEPIPNEPGDLSESITIPSTSVAGQYFRVYLKNWNKCNWADPDYVNTYIDILIVDAPDAPTIDDLDLCTGESTLLDPSSTPEGEFHWYNDAMSFITTGDTYDPGLTTPGVYTYYVTDQQLAGDLCESPPTEITITINPIPDQPTITRDNPDFCYDGISSITLTADPHAPPAVAYYRWYRNGTPVGGETSNTITLTDVSETGEYTVRSYGVAPTNCPSPLSDPIDVFIGEPAVVDAGPATATICSNTSYNTNGSFGGGATSATWSTSGDGSFGNTGDMTTTYSPGPNDISAGTVTITLTTNNPPGPCPAASDDIVITVVTAPTAYAGADDAICQGDIYTINDATASNYNTLHWTENGAGSITAGQGTLTPTYTPTPGDIGNAVTLTLRATGNGPCAQTSDSKVLFVDWTPTATVGARQDICNSTTANLQGNTGGNDLLNNASGEWTFINNLVWQETFSENPEGSTSGDQWTTSGVTPDAYTYFRTENHRIVARGTGTEGVWESEVFNISTYSSVKASVSLEEAGNLESNDYIRVYYRLNGGSQTYFTTNGNNQNDFGTRTASVTGLSGNTLQIVIRVLENSTAEYHYFDNIVVREETGTAEPTITTPSSATSGVSGLWQGDNHFRWSVYSEHNGCDSVSAVHTIRRDVQPTAASVGGTQEECETTTYTLTGNAVTDGGSGLWTLSGGFTGTITDPNDPTSTVTNVNYGTHTFTWTISSALGICADTDASLQIIRNEEPSPTITADAGPHCFDETVIIDGEPNLGIGASSVTTHAWSGTGAAYLDNASIEDPVFTAPSVLVPTDFDLIYTVIDDNGCTGVSATSTISVYPHVQSANIGSDHSICANLSTTIQVDITGGVGPYTVEYDATDTGGTTSLTENNYTSGSDITTASLTETTTYTLVSVTDANSCTATSLTGSAVITVGILPDRATLTPVATPLCTGVNAQLQIEIIDGVPPFDVTIDNGVGTIVVNGYSYTLDLGMGLAAGSHDYNITQIEDACNNFFGDLGSTATIVVNSRPDLTDGSTTLCSDEASGVTLGIDNAGAFGILSVTYDITNIVNNGLSPSAGSPATGTGLAANVIADDAWTNKTAGNVDVVYTIVPESDKGCTGNAEDITLTIQPEPDLNVGDIDICSDEPTGITFTDVQGIATSFNITNINQNGLTASAGAPATGNGLAANVIADDAFTNLTGADVNVLYTVVPVSTNGCEGDPEIITVTIHPEPDLNVGDVTVCSNEATGITLSDADGIASAYNITNINFNGLTASAGAPATGNGLAANVIADDAYTNTTAAPVDVVYTIVPVSANNCEGEAELVTVTVNPEPVLNSLSNTVCSDEVSAITLSDVNGIALSYNITDINANGLTASAGSPATGNGLAANVIADDAWTNKTGADVDVIYTVRPVSANNCVGDPETVTLTVHSEPDLNVADIDICSDEPTGITLTDVQGIATSFNITVINQNGLTASAGAPATGNGLAANVIADDAFTNLTGADVNVLYTVVPVSTNGCEGDPEIITVTVHPEPDLNVTGTTVCSDEVTGITLSDADGIASTYNITNINFNGLTASAGSPATGNGLAASVIADDAYANTTAAAVDVVYTIVPVSANNCEGEAELVTITVNPEPVLNSLSNTVCSDEPAAITLSDVNGIATSYNITNINANGLTASAGAPATGNGLAANVIADDAWTNKTGADVNVVYTVRPVSGNNCVGDPETVTLTVHSEPDLNVADTDICSDEPTGITLTDVEGIATSYNITVIDQNGLTASAGAPATGNGLAANVIADDAFTNLTGADVNVLYTVVPVSTNGCEGDPEVITVTVHPEPDLTVAGATVCSDEATGITLSDADGIASAYNITNINFNGLTASAGAPATGNGLAASVIADDAYTNTTAAAVDVVYTIVPVSANNCEGEAELVTITVNPEPVLNSLSNTVCSDEVSAITLSDVNGIATSYNITNINTNGLPASAGSPATGNGLAANIIADDAWTNKTGADVNVIYTVRPVSANSCVGDPETVTLTVHSEPDLNVGDIDICSDEPTGIILTDVEGIAISFNITVIDQNGLTASAGAPATGNGLAANVIADDAFTNLTGADVNVEYTVVPVSTNGCQGDPEVITVTVHPEPILANLDKTICSSNITGITLSATNITANLFEIVDIRIDAGITPGGSNATPGADQPADAIYNDIFTNVTGSILTVEYDIIPKVSATGCTGDLSTIILTVAAEPVLDPNLDRFACSDEPIGLVLAEAAGSVTPSHYNIISVTIDPTLGVGGSNAAVPEPTAAADYLQNDIYTNLTGVNKTVVYRVQPVLAPDCFGDAVDITITIRPEPVIVPGQTGTACSRVPINKEILLVPANTPAGTTFSWPAPTMSDASAQGTAQSGVAADPAGTYHITEALVNYTGAPITATYYVTPESAFSCVGETLPVVITINPEPSPNPISGRDKLCAGEINIVYNVVSNPGSIYTWTVPASVGIKTFDFNTNAIIINAAASAGIGDITMVETNSYGCSSDPNILNVEVFDPVAPENITGDNNVCAYQTETYSVPFNAGSTYQWSIPAGAAIQGDPSANEVTITFGINGGTISVREVIAAGCITDHNPFAVTVEPLPTATISNGGTICVEDEQPLQVSFTGSGDYTFVYAINGIDQPAISTTDNPYTLLTNTAGTYTITSVVDNITGCANTGSGSAIVSYHTVPTGTVTGTTDICEGESTVITLTFTGTAPFDFTYTDGTTPVTINGHPTAVYTFTVSPAITTSYTLVSLSDANGCEGTLLGSADITVNERPVLTLTPTHLLCNGDNSGEIDLEVTGNGPYGFAWTGPSGFTANTEDITSLAAGTYNVMVTDVNGCTQTGFVNITQPLVIDLSTSGNVALLCNGATTATGTFTVSGGTSPFTFNTISNTAVATINVPGANSIDFIDGGAGEVTIEVVDDNGCTDQATITITEPSAISVTAALSSSPEGSHNISCYDGSNGSIQLTVSGGTAPYVYAWSTLDGSGLDAADNGTQTGLTAGTYDVIITDANGCDYIDSYTLTEPTALSLTVSADDYIIGSCPTSDALITGTPSGGVELAGGGYLYSWSPAGGLADPNALTTTAKPGSTVTYTLTITDANGCTTNDNLQIEVRPALTAVAFADDNIIGTCPTSVANLDVNVNGGEELAGGGYSYSWSPTTGLDDPLSKTPEAKPAVTTTYTVTVTDANGCQTTDDVTITVAPDLAVTAAVDDPLIGDCPASTAQLDATVTGGEGGYTYLWDNAGTLDNATLRNPVAKPAVTTTYTVTVTDANGCTATDDVVVDIAPPLTATASTDDDIISTCPTSVANLDVTVGGGEAVYTYSWSPTAGLSDPFIQNPVAKPSATTTYTVTVTDANGCQATDNILITVQPPLTATATADDYIISTCPTSVANLSVVASGGEAGYTYSWSPAGSLDDPASATPVAKPTSTTIYTVTVTDVNGCEATANLTIMVRPDLVATATADDYIIGTCPASVATLNVSAFGGEELAGGGYTYSWTPAASLDDPASKNPVAKPAVTTTYTVTVTDANNCTTTADVTINVADPLTVTVTASDELIGTCPSSTSTLMATVTGGEGGFTYLWDNAGTLDDPNKINPVAKPAVSTTYTVTVTDANGCTTTGNITIDVAPELTVTAITDDDIISTCPSSVANLGAIVGGGEAGYTYRWSPTTGLDDPYIQTPVAKPNNTTTYTVEVTDANGCTTTDDILITVQPALTATASADDYILSTCPTSVANLDVTASGGEELAGGGYTYSWSPVASLDDPASQTPQAKPAVTTTYTVTVTDANGCTTTADVLIEVRPDLAATATADDYILSTCPTSVANLDVTVTGGEAGYTYSWTPVDGLDDPNIATPVAKPDVTTTYTVTVTDFNGCTTTDDIEIVVQPDLAATASADDYIISTCPSSVAVLDVTASGGEELMGGGYTYSWSPALGLSSTSSQNPTAKPVVTTTYTVTVTDRNGCTTTADVTITVADPLSATASVDDNLIGTCPTSMATLNVVATGGEELAGGGYTYLWDNAATLDDPASQTPVAKPPVTTTYTVTVTDANGCTTIASVTVQVAPELIATAVADDYIISTCPTSLANLDVNVSGGEAAYTYSWSPAATLNDPLSKTPEAKPAVTTTYTVTVTDANGCQTTADVEIVVQPDLTATASADDYIISTCPTSVSNLDVTASGGEELPGGGYTYSWSPVTGLNNPTSKTPQAKPAVTTTYTVTVTDRNGCTTTADVTITVQPDLTATATADDYLIGTCPTSMATLSVSASGGEELAGGGYTYSWTPAASLDDPASQTPVAKPAITTNYTVTVTDANGCTTTDNVIIEVAPVLNATATASDMLIGDCPGSSTTLDVNVTGGEELAGGGYTYSWTPAASLDDPASKTPVATPAVTTTYTVTVTDANGCTTTADVIITVADPLTVTATTDDNLIGTCPTSVANLFATASGGEAPYSYSWNNGTTLDDDAIQGPQAKPAVSTTYTVTVTDANGCTATANVTVNVAPDLAVTASADDLLIGTCPSSVANLDATASGGEAGYTYRWTPSTGLSDPYAADPVAKPNVTTIYTIEVTDANGCTATDQVTITVADPLTATASVDDNLIGSCPSSVATLSVNATGGEELAGGGYTYSWSPAGSLDDPASQTPMAKPAVTTTYTVTVTDANGCTTMANITLQVASPINVSAMADDLIIGTCPSSESNLSATAFGGEELAGGGYTWSWSPVAGLDDPNISTPVAKPAVTTTYTLTVTDANGCQATDDVTIVVAPDLTAVASTDDPLISTCPISRANLDVTPTGGEELPGGGYTYSWSPVDGLNNPFSKTPVAKPAATTTYTVTVTDANGCTTTADVTITVADPIVISHTALTYNGGWNVSCLGEADGEIDLTVTGGEAPYGYSWSGPGGFNSTDEDLTGLIAGTYMVTVTDANGCISTYNIMLTTPAALQAVAVVSSDHNGRDISCNGASDGAIDLTVTGGTAPYSFAWTGPAAYTSTDEDPSGLVAGPYDVTVTDANGCITTASVTLTEPEVLEINPTNDQLLDCYGDADGYGTFYAQGGTMPYTFTEVNNTAGATLAAPGVNSQGIFGASAGVVTIRVTDINGCFAEATITFTQPDPLLAGEIEDDQTICFGDDPAPITELTPATGGPGAYTYQWQMSSNIAGPFTNIPGANAVTYDPPAGIATTTYYRREVRSGICTPEYTDPVEVLVNPLPSGLLTGGATICPGETAILNVTMGTGTGPFEVEIENHGIVSDYTSGDDIIVTPVATTTYRLLRITDANSCEVLDPSPFLNGTATVTVRDLPVITDDPDDMTLCEFTMATFTAAASGTDLTYQWEVFDGSTWDDVVDGGVYYGASMNSLMIFSVTRGMNNYRYRMTATTCGTDAVTTEATLYVQTAPEITEHPRDTIVCEGEFAYMKVVAEGTSLDYQWQVNAGGGFTNISDDINYSGSLTDSLAITGTPLTYNNYLYRLVIDGTCGVPVYTNFAVLHVTPPPTVTLDPADREICEIGNTYLTGNGWGYTSLIWQLNDGSGWTDLTDDANHLGTGTQQLTLSGIPVSFDGYQYRLALVNNCDSTYTTASTLTVNANPLVDFSAIDPLFNCGGTDLQLNGNPTGGSGVYTTHMWTGQVGPLNQYAIVDPVFNTGIKGTYNLTYTVIDDNGCQASDNLSVDVEKPTAAFTANPTSGCTPLDVNMTDASIDAVIYRWDFGDGSPEDNTAGNVSHQYNNITQSIEYFNIKLEVESMSGCLDSMIRGVTIYPEIDADFEFDEDTVCSGDFVYMTSLPGAYQYFWDYGDGWSEYGANVAGHMFVNTGTGPVTYTVRLTTTSFYSCQDWVEKDIVVYPVPAPLFTANPPLQTWPDATVSFTNNTNAGTWDYLWRFGDNTTSTESDPTHIYTAPGDYKVWLVVNNAYCSDSIDRNISILPTAPIASFDSIPGACSPYTVTFNNTSQYADSYLWEFGDGGVSEAENPTYTYLESGIFRITLTVRGPGGTDIISKLVHVYASPIAYFEVAPTFVYVDDERVRCFNLSQGGDSFIWEFGDGDTSHMRDPYHKYMQEGIYDITLHAYSVNGCYDSYTLSPAVTVEPAGVIRFANVFRPNKEGPLGRDASVLSSDQIDMMFFPPVKEQVTEYKLQIFNRAGVLIFQSNSINEGWDGYYKGRLVMQGVYVWYVEGKYANGEPFKKAGDITLLH